MRKILAITVTIITILSLATPVFADIFTDFENYSAFNAGGNPIFNIGETVSDYWVGEWDSGILTEASGIAIENEKGYEGSKALALWENDFANQGLYLFVTPSNNILSNHSDTVYLRVWMDLTAIGFRKANFGVTDGNYNLYTTDELNTNVTEWPFYYKAEDSDTWETLYHGDDGCFGDAQGYDVAGYKGFFAFPVSDFVIRDNAANHDSLELNTPAPLNNITSVYLFWDYTENLGLAGGEKFYLDNIEFVKDYNVFDSTFYVKPVAETEAPVEVAVTPAATENTAEQTAATQTAAAQTADITLLIGISTFVSSAISIILIKRKK